jgi:hypothetical protein
LCQRASSDWTGDRACDDVNATLPILVIAAGAGVWLAIALLVLRALGISIS